MLDRYRYAKCPSCGVLHPVPDTHTHTHTHLAPCPRCAIRGHLSRLAWEAPRRNRYNRTVR